MPRRLASGRSAGDCTTRGTCEVAETQPEMSLDVSLEMNGYWFWGEHGFAAMLPESGPLSAEIEETAFNGDFSTARRPARGRFRKRPK